MHWMQELDKFLIPELTATAACVLGDGCRCEPNFEDGSLRIFIQPLPDFDTGRAAQDRVLARARELCPTLGECRVYFKTPQRTTYTSHLSIAPHNIRPIGTTSFVTTFDLLLPDLIDLRDAESELAKQTQGASRVATFALGGVSTLSRLSMQEWDALALRPLRDGVAAYELVREKYHLFPGLNWPFENVKQVFLEWIMTIDRPGKILLFDTGTEGNAPRQIFNLLKDALRAAMARCDLEIEIVGIVDGSNPASVDDAGEGKTASGHHFLITVRYIKVARVLSEDFQSLVGYKKLGKEGCVAPLRDLGIVRLVADDGRLLQITGSDNLSNVFRGYMTNAIGGRDRLAQKKGHEVLTVEIERGIVGQVLATACNGELQHLINARVAGFISDDRFRDIVAEMERRYEDEWLSYPKNVWSLKEKKYVKGGLSG
jgi:hypothetical protein